jgi:hypothetical protein
LDAADDSEQGDLGRQILLERRPRPRLFQVTSESQYLYTSNVLLTDGEIFARTDDALFFEQLTAMFSPRLLPHLNSTLYARYQIVRFDQNGFVDFDGNEVGLSLSYPVEHWFKAYGGFSASRQYFAANDHEFFKMFDAQFGLRHDVKLCSYAWLFVGYQLDWRPSSPSALTRIDNAGYVGLDMALVDKLTAQLLYRLRLEEFLQDNRTDVNHLLSLAVTYAFNDFISVRAFVTYGINDSNQTVHDFNVFTSGAGINLQVRF